MIKARFIFAILVLFAAFGSACAGGNGDYTPAQAKEKMKKKDVVVVDVRTPQEWNQGHLKDAVHNDVFAEDFDDKVRKMKPSTTYIVYCKSGGRSSMAIDKMKKAGLKRVHNMLGGYLEWVAMGYPVVR